MLETSDKYHTMPMIMKKEFEDFKKLIDQDNETGGEMCMTNIKKDVGLKSLFFKDKEKPAEKKVLVTDEEADNWLASHYGVSIDAVPQIKPNEMPESLFKNLQKHSYARRGLSADKKAKRMMQNKKASSDGLVTRNAYVLSPDKF